jgi:peptide deformylase
MFKIITNPNPILRKKSQPVKNILDPELQKMLPEMVETMIKKDGVGLAAPQIGKNIRLVTIRFKNNNLILFNPVIVKKSIFKEWDEEGCLSVPNVFGDVKRNKKIVVEYFDASEKKQILEAQGLLARIVQHELDHLDGIIFIDKAKRLRKLDEETY